MIPRIPAASSRLARQVVCPRCRLSLSTTVSARLTPTRLSPLKPPTRLRSPLLASTLRPFSTTPRSLASPQGADPIVERLTDLYGTARDEFEIAAEETTKKTVYAADDREAAKEAFEELKTAFSDAVRQSDPEVAKEVQRRVEQRIRELENALTALEESALED